MYYWDTIGALKQGALMRKLVLSSIACIFLASAGGATAADVKGPPVAPARVSPSWTGFYLGLNGGFGVSRSISLKFQSTRPQHSRRARGI
jgi:hypothetical protein